MALVAEPGKLNSSLNWLIRSASLSPLPTTRPALPNGTLLSTASFPRSPRTGQANHSTAIRRSSTSFDPPELKPACRSPRTSTAATILPASNQRPNNSNLFVCSRTRFCPCGITRSHPICEVVFASGLRGGILLPDGRVFFVFFTGSVLSGTLAAVELYDPWAGRAMKSPSVSAENLDYAGSAGDLRLSSLAVLPSRLEHTAGTRIAFFEAQFPARRCLCLRFT